jgi:hypothetical protein
MQAFCHPLPSGWYRVRYRRASAAMYGAQRATDGLANYGGVADET